MITDVFYVNISTLVKPNNLIYLTANKYRDKKFNLIANYKKYIYIFTNSNSEGTLTLVFL